MRLSQKIYSKTVAVSVDRQLVSRQSGHSAVVKLNLARPYPTEHCAMVVPDSIKDKVGALPDVSSMNKGIVWYNAMVRYGTICEHRYSTLHTGSLKIMVGQKLHLRAIKRLQIKFQSCAFSSTLRDIWFSGIKIEFSFKIE